VNIKLVAVTLLLLAKVSFSQTDALTPWIYGSYGTDATRGSFYVTGLQREYTGSTSRRIFSRIEMAAVKINGTTYRLNSIKTAPSYTRGVWDPGLQMYYDHIYAEYTAGSYTVACQYKLYRKGMMEVIFASWNSSGVVGRYISDAFVRMDFDLNATYNDLSEFATTTGVNSTYGAPANEVMVSRTPISLASDPGVERQVYARFSEATAPGNQLSVYVNPTSSMNAVDIYFKKYAYPAGLPTIPPTVSGALQNTASLWGATYGHTGSDQEAWFNIKPSSTGDNLYGLQINVARKFTGRPLKINWTQHIGLLNPFPTQDFLNVRTVHPASACNNRNFNDAMFELTGNNNNVVVGPTMTTNPFPGVFDCTQGAWSSADIHAYMLANRTIPTQDRTDYTKWYIQVDFLNVYLNPSPSSTPSGLLFDCPGCTYGVNSPPYREEVVVFAPCFNCGNPTSMRNNAGTMITFMEVVAHEVSHAIGMGHFWQETIATGCESLEGPHSSVPIGFFPQSMRFSPRNTIEWYQNGPESPVKPGKYSTDWFSSSSRPQFIRADGMIFN
jgi:hypothetical protein